MALSATEEATGACRSQSFWGREIYSQVKAVALQWLAELDTEIITLNYYSSNWRKNMWNSSHKSSHKLVPNVGIVMKSAQQHKVNTASALEWRNQKEETYRTKSTCETRAWDGEGTKDTKFIKLFMRSCAYVNQTLKIITYTLRTKRWPTTQVTDWPLSGSHMGYTQMILKRNVKTTIHR